MKKVVTFGEIMLRLAPPGYLRFSQANSFDANYGGGEANVAVSLANYGLPTEFVTRLPNTEVIYKSTNYYAPDCDYTVRFDDPDIGIDWGLNGEAIVSKKDASAPLLKNIKSPFIWS